VIFAYFRVPQYGIEVFFAGNPLVILLLGVQTDFLPGIEMQQKAMDYIRTAPDRDEAFADALKGIDMALERSRSLGLGR